MTGLTEDNSQEALRILLCRLNTKFTNYSIRSLKQHPSYPSLLSINHTLAQLQIDNVALRATYDQLLQSTFPKPLLVHTTENGGTYQVVDHLDEEQILFVNSKGKLESQPKNEFLKVWSGVVMLVDEQTQGKEPNYALNRIKDFLSAARLPLAMLGILLLLFYIGYYTSHLTSVFDYLFLSTKVLGIVVTVPLIVRSIDRHSKWAGQLCSAGGKFDCNSILDTPAARIWELFSWSEIGFLYFTVLFGYLLLFPTHTNWYVVGLSLLAAPFIVYSVYYQARVAKRWCRLCLLVQGVLLLDLVLAIAVLATDNPAPVNAQSTLALGLTGFLFMAVYSYWQPVWAEQTQLKQQLPLLHRIKFNEQVFHTLVKQQPIIDTANFDAPQLSNPLGKHQLTIISNPKCLPCVKMHQKLPKILANKENVGIREIFMTSGDKDSSAYQVAVCMLAMHQTKSATQVQEAIKKYYQTEYTNLEAWLQQHKPIDANIEEAEKVLEQHIAWCWENKLLETPTVLYNGYRLPSEYTIEDLNYLFD